MTSATTSAHAEPGIIPALTVGERLDRLPIGPFHWRLIALIGGGLFVDVYDQTLAGAVLATLVKSGESNLTLNGWFLSSTFLGLLVGAWIAGILSDRFGRRVSFQINLLIFGGFSMAAAAAPNMTWLIALRFLMSVGLGAEVVVAAATLMEFIPARLRGRMIAALALCSPFSTLLANILGSTLIPIAGWQVMFLIAGVGALSIWVLRKGMPESPRWLESQSRYEEAEAIVRMVEAEAYQTCAPVGTATPAQPPAVSASILFTKSVLPLSALAVSLNMTVQTVVWILNGWLPSFLVKQGLTLSSSLAFAALLSVGSVGGSLIAIATVDRIGRRPGIVAASVVGMIAAALFPYAADLTQSVISGMIMSAAIYYLLSVVFYVYQGEIFPTVFRQRGVGLGIASGRLILVLSPYLIVPLYGLGGTQAVFSLVAGLLLITLLVIVTIGIETRGQSLEAISEGVGQET
jgi:MFS transporter, putative metabolite:H+ symporter